MAKFCTNCGKELDENAAMCLNCGVIVGNNPVKANTTNNNGANKKKKGLPIWAIVLIVVGCVVLLPIIVLVVIGLFAYNTINDVVDNYDDYYNEETVTKTGTIGDTLSTDKFKITLNEAVMYGGIEGEYYTDTPDTGKEYLIFFFDIQNISDESEYISYYDFSGYVDDYAASVTYLLNDVNDYEELATTLNPGTKTKGYVAFEIDENWDEFDIVYTELFEDEELIFSVVNPD